MHTNNIAKGKIVLKKEKTLNILHPKYYEPNTHLTFLSQEIQLKPLSGVFEKKKEPPRLTTCRNKPYYSITNTEFLELD